MTWCDDTDHNVWDQYVYEDSGNGVLNLTDFTILYASGFNLSDLPQSPGCFEYSFRYPGVDGDSLNTVWVHLYNASGRYGRATFWNYDLGLSEWYNFLYNSNFSALTPSWYAGDVTVNDWVTNTWYRFY